MFHSNNCSSNRVRRRTLTRNPISAESTTLPLLIGIKQRYPSICLHTPLHLHLFVNRIGSLTRYGQTPPVRHIILVLSPIVAFLLGRTTCTRRASVVKLSNFKGRKVLPEGPRGEPCHSSNSSTCHRSMPPQRQQLFAS